MKILPSPRRSRHFYTILDTSLVILLLPHEPMPMTSPPAANLARRLGRADDRPRVLARRGHRLLDQAGFTL
jgi:hypothetical protein